MLQYILWDVSPILARLGSIELRWYGLLFMMAFVLGQIVITHILVRDGRPARDVDTLTIYMLVSTVVGARLGHCLFYEPEFFLTHPIEILKIWNGGLASHGATIGIIAAMWLYSRKRPHQSFLWILDRIVIVVALGGALIRTGNLFNSEIVGRPTDVPWAFLFVHPVGQALERNLGELAGGQVSYTYTGRDTVYQNQDRLALVEQRIPFAQPQEELMRTYGLFYVPQILEQSPEASEHVVGMASPLATTTRVQGRTLTQTIAVWPRHPAQLYEGLSTLALFFLLYLIWRTRAHKLAEGTLFAVFVVVLFSLRIAYEFFKENQVDFEDELALNLGQLLSIPLVIAGIGLLVWVILKGRRPGADDPLVVKRRQTVKA